MYYTLKNFDGWKKKKKTLNCPNKVIDETLKNKIKRWDETLLKKIEIKCFFLKKNKKVKEFFFFLEIILLMIALSLGHLLII